MNDWLVKAGLAAVSTGLCAATLACGSSAEGSEPSECVSGRSVECIGPSGCQGYQACDEQGSYEPCRCTTQDDAGSAPSTSRLDAGSSTHDASARDSSAAHQGTGGTGSTGGTPTDADIAAAGSQEVSPPSEGGTSSAECKPEDMKSWSPPSYVPARTPQEVCTDSDIEAFTRDCLLGADCSAFEDDGPSTECGACLRPTALAEPDYGPVIELNPRPFYRWDANVAGCVELSGEAECAESIQAARVCAQASCSTSCDAGDAAFGDCMDAARTATCAEYEQAAVCIMDPATAERCTASGFAGLVLALGRVFCGGGAP